jgi:hypothetical protein
MNARIQLAALRAQQDGTAPHAVFRWDDNSALMRVPKALLDRLPVSAVTDKSGRLSEQIKEILQLTTQEAESAQSAIHRFLDKYHKAQALKTRPIEPAEADLNGRTPDEVRVFEVPAIPEELALSREELFSELEAALGADRASRFRQALEDWMPVDDQDRGMNSGMAVFNFDHRLRFYKPKPDEGVLGWSISGSRGGLSVSIRPDEIPNTLRPYLEDWIALAESQPAAPAVP